MAIELFSVSCHFGRIQLKSETRLFLDPYPYLISLDPVGFEHGTRTISGTKMPTTEYVLGQSLNNGGHFLKSKRSPITKVQHVVHIFATELPYNIAEHLYHFLGKVFTKNGGCFLQPDTFRKVDPLVTAYLVKHFNIVCDHRNLLLPPTPHDSSRYINSIIPAYKEEIRRKVKQRQANRRSKEKVRKGITSDTPTIPTLTHLPTTKGETITPTLEVPVNNLADVTNIVKDTKPAADPVVEETYQGIYEDRPATPDETIPNDNGWIEAED